MNLQKASHRTSTGASYGPAVALTVFAVLAMVVLSSLPTEAVLSHVSISGIGWSSGKPQPGDNANAVLTVTNTAGSEVRIKWIGVHFDWQAPNTYYFNDYNSGPIPIEASSDYPFSFLVLIPASANFTVHPYSVKVVYESGSSSYTETSDTQYDFTLVKYVPPVSKPFWSNPLFIVLIVLVVVAVILIVVMVALRHRRLAKEAAKKQLEMRSCVTTTNENGEVELAKTVTKDTGRFHRVDNRPKHWDTSKDKRITGETSKPPIYRLLGKGQEAPQPMPQAPPQVQPIGPPQVQPPPGQGPQQMPARPPPTMMPAQQPPRLPPPLSPQAAPPTDQATLHQCPICGRMNKATDTTCPKCGGAL